ncbi:MAG TPA: dihydrodipicolinate synthase family protein [Bryobacteraceae bacterium]|nr:dihydrodipicolinate synthase family protein [Bryobacteraceae bacterium]
MPGFALHGISPSLVTPFSDDERIDYGAWQRIIDSLIAAGVDGLFVCGSTGEFHALDAEERTVALRFCRQAAAARVPVCGNVGCATTRDTVSLALQAQSVGIDVLAVVTPYYTRTSQEELAAHYCEVCRSVRLPVLAYNLAHHDSSELLPETAGRIAAACGNFLGILDAGRDLKRMAAYRTCAPGREMAVFVGPESLLLPGLECGCAGSAATGINIAPKLFVDLYRAFHQGQREEARRLQALATLLGRALGLHTFPAAAKEAMQAIGLPAGWCRRPVGPMPPEACAELARVLEVLREQGYLPAALQRRAAGHA